MLRCLLLVLLVLTTALDFGSVSATRLHRNGLAYMRLTTPQQRVAEDVAPKAIWRDGNRLGKSQLLAWETLHRARGTHPFKMTHRPPVNILLASVSLDQMMPLMGKLWELVPKDEIDPRNSFDAGRGITGKPPRIVFVKGPGKGTVISFATYKQGTTRIAGGEYHFVGLDEPCPEGMWGEVMPRVFSTHGDILVTFTPTPDMPSQKYMADLVKRGRVHEHNFHLKEENCWVQGAPRPFYTQAEIDEYTHDLLGHERMMRIEGAWEPIFTHRWLLNYNEKNVSKWSEPPAGAYLGIGIDHGAAAGKQAAMLVAFEDREGDNPRVWYWDESVSDGYTTPEDDARSILDMLGRHSLSYDDVDEWVGDRPTGENRYLVGKNNKDLRRQLARLLRRPVEKTKTIHTPYKWQGSVSHGLRMINGLFGRATANGSPAAVVSPRCETFIEFCRTFRGSSRDPLKDVGDAGRYITERAIKRQGRHVAVAHY